jgi:deoxyribonuclease-4
MAARPLLGIHASTAGGVAEAIPRAAALGCESMQVFTRSQRQWRARPLDDPDVAEFRRRLDASPIRVAVSHDSYLINLASPARPLHRRSVAAFRDEMDRAEALGIRWVVFHPGAHMEAGAGAGIERIRSAVQALLDATPRHRVGLCFENAAGQGTTLGRTLEELATLVRGLTPRRRVGVCLDTCHLFAAGYDLRTSRAYAATMREVERTVGTGRVQAFHLNDSRRELGSRVDRHANIGRGHLGTGAFRLLLRDDRWAGLPMVLETPGGPAWFARDLRALRRLGGYPARSAG